MRSQLPWVAGRFRANRQVEVICRDRGASYSAAANSAAPQAVQVADRWHLFENASEAFLQAVRAELPRLRKALAPKAVIDPATLTRAERLQWEGALARTAINEQVEALASTGNAHQADRPDHGGRSPDGKAHPAGRVNAGRIPGQCGGVKAGHFRRGLVVCKKAPDRGPFCKWASASGVSLR
jgi:hypothetical protein